MSFEKSNGQILEIKSVISEIKRDKFWKSKVSFQKSNGQILEIKGVILEIKRDKFKIKMTQ